VLGDTSTLERGALDFPTELNAEMEEAVGRSRALVGSVPRYHHMPSVYEVVRPFNIAKDMQRRHLQPEPPSVNQRPQVYGLICERMFFLFERFALNFSRRVPSPTYSTARAKFGFSRVRGFDSVGGRIFGFFVKRGSCR